jgi:hypothetical protein
MVPLAVNNTAKSESLLVNAPLNDAGDIDLLAFAARLADATADSRVRHLICEQLNIPTDLRTGHLLRSFGIGFCLLAPVDADSDEDPRGCISFADRDPATGTLTGIVLLSGDDRTVKHIHYGKKDCVLFNVDMGLTLLHDMPPKYLITSQIGPALRLASEGFRVMLRPFDEESTEPVLIVYVVKSNGEIVRLIDNDTDKGVVVREPTSV